MTHTDIVVYNALLASTFSVMLLKALEWLSDDSMQSKPAITTAFMMISVSTAVFSVLSLSLPWKAVDTEAIQIHNAMDEAEDEDEAQEEDENEAQEEDENEAQEEGEDETDAQDEDETDAQDEDEADARDKGEDETTDEAQDDTKEEAQDEAQDDAPGKAEAQDDAETENDNDARQNVEISDS